MNKWINGWVKRLKAGWKDDGLKDGWMDEKIKDKLLLINKLNTA